MRRFVTKKVAHLSEQKLDVVKNQIISSQGIVSDLRKKAELIKEEIEVNNNLAKEAKLNRVKAEKELKSSLSKGQEELFNLNKKTNEASAKLAGLTYSVELTEKDLKEKTEYLKQQIDYLKEKLTNEERLYGNKIKKLVDELEELSEKKNTLFDQYDSLGTQTSVREIELTMLDKKIDKKKVELEKIEVQIQRAVDSLEKSSQFAKNADDKIKEELSKLGLVKEELSELEENVKKGKKKIYDQKEYNASLVQREVALEKREEKVKAIYKKVGIDKKL